MRLIDADALMDKMQRKTSGVADKRFTEGFNYAVARFRSMIHGAPTIDAVPVVRCRECVFFRERHVRTKDGQMKSYDEFPPEAFSRLGTGDVTSDYGINVGSQCLVDCNRGYGEDKTVFRQPDDYCSRGVRKIDAKMDGGADDESNH